MRNIIHYSLATICWLVKGILYISKNISIWKNKFVWTLIEGLTKCKQTTWLFKIFDRDLAKLSRSYKWLAGDVAFSCWFGRYVAWRWRRCCQAETWPDVVNFLYCNDCSALLSNVIITEFIYVEAEKCWIIRFSRFSCFKKA